MTLQEKLKSYLENKWIIVSNAPISYLYDPEGNTPCQLYNALANVPEPEREKCLRVDNTAAKRLYFIQNDNALDLGSQKCEGWLLAAGSWIAVELKMNVKIVEPKEGSFKRNFKKALEQIRESLIELKVKYPDLFTYLEEHSVYVRSYVGFPQAFFQNISTKYRTKEVAEVERFRLNCENNGLPYFLAKPVYRFEIGSDGFKTYPA